MKSLIGKLIPGVVATFAALLVGVLCIAKAQQPAPAAAQPVPQFQTVPQPAPEQYTICGVCGARILAPQTVLVAQPYYPAAPRQGYGYGAQPVAVVRGQDGYYLADDCGDYDRRIQPAPVFSLTDYGRADPRLIRREHGERRFR